MPRLRWVATDYGNGNLVPVRKCTSNTDQMWLLVLVTTYCTEYKIECENMCLLYHRCDPDNKIVTSDMRFAGERQ